MLRKVRIVQDDPLPRTLDAGGHVVMMKANSRDRPRLSCELGPGGVNDIDRESVEVTR